MGLLDDAIREHLDLKRRRGADPAEIERSAREALGPVRRNREAPGEPVDESTGVAVPGTAFEEPDEPIAADLADEAFDDDLEEDDPFDDLDVAHEPEPAPETRVMAPEEVQGLSERTAEYDVEEALVSDRDPPEDEGDDAEDVLEETPEFLQDTPDHDRLWFEQRPPRDFDFDG